MLVVILACAAIALLCWNYPHLLALIGISHDGVWFMDTYAILAALDAQRLGADPFSYNPLNHNGGPHVYSHWWFWLGPTGLTRADTFWVGSIVLALTLLTAWLVLRPRNIRETGWILGVLLSSPILLGFNRANVDLLLFALLSFSVPCMLSRYRLWRICGAPVLVAIAMGLKFYPAVAGLILLAIRPRLDRNLALFITVGLLGMTTLSIVPDLFHYMSDRLPRGLYTFGSPILFLEAGLPTTLAPVVATLVLVVVGYWFVRQTPLQSWTVPPELTKEYLYFILGAVILTGSFVVTINYAYRWIFVLWMLPFLYRLKANPSDRFISRLQGVTRWLLIPLLWVEPLVALGLNLTPQSQEFIDRWIDLTMTLLQPVVWLMFACLSGWLANFVVTQWHASSDRLQSPASLK